MLLRDSVPSPPKALGSNGMETSSAFTRYDLPSLEHGVNVTFPALRLVSENSAMVFLSCNEKNIKLRTHQVCQMAAGVVRRLRGTGVFVGLPSLSLFLGTVRPLVQELLSAPSRFLGSRASGT